jgi:hypothetical protein
MVCFALFAFWCLVNDLLAGLMSKPAETQVEDLLYNPAYHSAEDRLDELERLKRRDMVTQEEYATKRQEILKDL